MHFFFKWTGLKRDLHETFLLRAGVICENALTVCLPETQIFLPLNQLALLFSVTCNSFKLKTKVLVNLPPRRKTSIAPVPPGN